jgi:hypothetical protein
MNWRTGKTSIGPRSFVVRIYRQTSRTAVGQVEDVQTGLVRPFRTVHELWRALMNPNPTPNPKDSKP